MAKTVQGQISAMIRDVEKAARQIRSEVSKQYKATPKALDDAASQLRRGAAEAAYQVERYIREFRIELQEGAKKKPRRKATKRRAAKKRTAKKRTTKKRAAKKTAKRATKKTARKATTKKRTRKTAKKAARKRSTR